MSQQVVVTSNSSVKFSKEGLRRIEDAGHVIAGRYGIYTHAGKAELSHYSKRELRWARLAAKSSAHDIMVADFACGNGHVLALLGYLATATNGKEVKSYHVDIRQEALNEFKSNQRATVLPENCNPHVVQADLTRGLPKRLPSEVQAVYSRNALHWLGHHAEEHFRHSLKRLSPGGVIYVETVTPFNAMMLGRGVRNKLQIAQRHKEASKDSGSVTIHSKSYQLEVTGFLPQFFENIASQTGMRILEMETFHNPAYPNGLDDRFPENINLLAQKKR